MEQIVAVLKHRADAASLAVQGTGNRSCTSDTYSARPLQNKIGFEFEGNAAPAAGQSASFSVTLTPQMSGSGKSYS